MSIITNIIIYIFVTDRQLKTDLSDLRLAKGLQSLQSLHYVLKFKRPLEIYEASAHKKERKKNVDFIYQNSSSVCCMIMVYAIYNPFLFFFLKNSLERSW